MSDVKSWKSALGRRPGRGEVATPPRVRTVWGGQLFFVLGRALSSAEKEATT